MLCIPAIRRLSSLRLRSQPSTASRLWRRSTCSRRFWSSPTAWHVASCPRRAATPHGCWRRQMPTSGASPRCRTPASRCAAGAALQGACSGPVPPWCTAVLRILQAKAQAEVQKCNSAGRIQQYDCVAVASTGAAPPQQQGPPPTQPFHPNRTPPHRTGQCQRQHTVAHHSANPPPLPLLTSFPNPLRRSWAATWRAWSTAPWTP